MAKGIIIEAQAEYFLKYISAAAEEVVLISLSELAELMNTGILEGEEVSWISLEMPTGFVTYSFLDKEWSADNE